MLVKKRLGLEYSNGLNNCQTQWTAHWSQWSENICTAVFLILNWPYHGFESGPYGWISYSLLMIGNNCENAVQFFSSGQLKTPNKLIEKHSFCQTVLSSLKRLWRCWIALDCRMSILLIIWTSQIGVESILLSSVLPILPSKDGPHHYYSLSFTKFALHI